MKGPEIEMRTRDQLGFNHLAKLLKPIINDVATSDKQALYFSVLE